MLDEPVDPIPYLSVFITHFLNKPKNNLGIFRKLYLDHGLSVREIESITESAWSKTTIIETMREKKITKSSNAKSNRLKYGERKVQGLIVPHLEEQKIIQKIIGLKNEGFSLRKIAKFLMEKNIKSKRGDQWDKSVIGDILKRELKDV
ncbi:MAG: hypothetical protein DRQ88_00785 [Epsilonproteobacteria bacterium]|nr:MAG: hypothetical protein DRQ89_10320 [Campylobacterota bacterium]RLA68170.1 MAG: hypothetical protein DRQ88_00785 [Campylobacterota bacterium]